jgi:phosphatidylserine/phosphatidylglycerophosphate/cardiolipin synthase-like enzyme
VIGLGIAKFEFSSNVTESILYELERAEVFIKIAMFQIHRSEIFEVLKKKLIQGVKIEMITLPYDSIKKKIRKDVQERFEDLRNHGAVIYFCRWNIGDPSRTTTAVGRWYSFHGKMIVTDKCSIALTANFTEEKELDAAIFFRDNEKKEEFLKVFDFLLNLFIIPEGENTGTIKNKIRKITGSNERLFELPAEIPELHKEFWITDYPAELCPIPNNIEERLYIAPFDCRGRHMLEKVIEEANDFVYLSTETFTDPDFSVFLIKTAVNKKLDLKIICGIFSMDFSDRINEMLRNMIAQGINIRVPSDKIHGKLIVTEKAVVVSSINLNKMNLGFSRGKHLWRGNTEIGRAHV